MSKSDPEDISSYSGEDFTEITFIPDYKKFHMKELNKDNLGKIILLI